MIHDESFSAIEAVHSLEMGVRKMDASFELKTAVTVLKSGNHFDTSTIDASHVKLSIDIALAAFHSWLDNGASVSQSLFGFAWFHELGTLASSSNPAAIVLHHALYSILAISNTAHDFFRVSGVATINEDYSPFSTTHEVIAVASIPLALTQLTHALEISSGDAQLTALIPHLEALHTTVLSFDTLLMFVCIAVVDSFTLSPLDQKTSGQAMKEYQLRNNINSNVELSVKDLSTEVGKRLSAAANLLTTLSKSSSTEISPFFPSSSIFDVAISPEVTTMGPPKYVTPLPPSRAYLALAKIFNSVKTAIVETVSSASSLQAIIAAQRRRLRSKPSLMVRVAVTLILTCFCDIEGVRNDSLRNTGNIKKYSDAVSKLAAHREKQKVTAVKTNKKGGKDSGLEDFAQEAKLTKNVEEALSEVSKDSLGANSPRSFVRLVLDELVKCGLPEAFRNGRCFSPAVVRIFDANSATVNMVDELMMKSRNPEVELDTSELHEHEQIQEFADILLNFNQTVVDFAQFFGLITRLGNLNLSTAYRQTLYGKTENSVLCNAVNLFQSSSAMDQMLSNSIGNKFGPSKPSFSIVLRSIVTEVVLFHLISGFELELFDFQDVHMVAWAICDLCDQLLSCKRVLLSASGSPPRLPDTPESLAYTGLYYYFKGVMHVAEFLMPLTFGQVIHDEQAHSRFTLRFHGLLYRWPVLSFSKYVKSARKGLENHDVSLLQATNAFEDLQKHAQMKEVENVKLFDLMSNKCPALGQTGAEGASILKSITLNKLCIARLSKLLGEFEKENDEKDFFTVKGLKLNKFKIATKGHPLLPVIEF